MGLFKIKYLTLTGFLPFSDLGLFLQISLDQHDVWEVQSKDLCKAFELWLKGLSVVVCPIPVNHHRTRTSQV